MGNTKGRPLGYFVRALDGNSNLHKAKKNPVGLTILVNMNYSINVFFVYNPFLLLFKTQEEQSNIYKILLMGLKCFIQFKGMRKGVRDVRNGVRSELYWSRVSVYC